MNPPSDSARDAEENPPALDRFAPRRAPAARLDRLWQLGALALVAAIAWASLTPHPIDTVVRHGDKLQHLAGYGALMLWCAQLRGARWRIALACIGLGVAMEILQGATGFRRADAWDALANSAGVAAGWLVASRLPNLREYAATFLASRHSSL